jgi:signal transduction histidine kinase/DNA-binding response OmpR family regulator
MPVNLFTIEIRLENDVVLARQKARTVAAAIGFDVQDQTRIATAVSEIARNTFEYGGGGRAEFRIENGPDRILVVTIRDEGKGIAQLDDVLNGTYVSKTGMGVGIIGAKRLMDHFRIETSHSGTIVELGKSIPLKFSKISPAHLDSLLSRIEKAAQSPYEELQQQNKELLRTLEELKSRQDELAQLNRELDETNRGVVALYAELNDRADFLQRASELKSHFLSNMSHEFRTPLNSITALSQILVDRLDGELTAEQEKQVKFIRKSAQDLTDLVNDLLDLAKVEAGKVIIRPAKFEIPSLFAALRGMLRPLLIQNSSVNLVFEDSVGLPEMFSDEAKVSQILRNFISNALKFTERGEVRVSATQDGDVIVFTVSDTGIGIAPQDCDLIFEEWTQVEGKIQKKVKGTGLGLPLSRKFAQLLGGDVSVRSELGIGSTFFARIPVQFSGATTVAVVPEVRRELDADKLPVLVVEDNREALFIYEKYLKNTRFQVVPARTVKEARAALKEFRPRAVVLDVLLETEHSWDLLQEIKENPETAKIPVFVVTVVDNRDKATILGADGFHAKPVDRTWLIHRLESSELTQSKRVLLVDDDEVSRYLVRNLLDPAGFQFVEAADGQDAMQKAEEALPDLIVLDVVMPELSGIEVLRSLKGNPRTSKIPVVIHTSKKLDASERHSLQDAIAIIPKENESREELIEHFEAALMKAGFAHPPLLQKKHHAPASSQVGQEI